MKTTGKRHQGFRARVYTGLLVALVFLISACGAEVDTVFDLQDGVKGTRTITAKISNSDIESHVTGGVDAIDASIRKHLPAELNYGGTEVGTENVQVTFTLNFDSEKNYVEKVTALLRASNSETEPETRIGIEDSVFVSGLTIDENFTSSDLIRWLGAGLVGDGVISLDNKDSVLSSTGDSQVLFNGKKYSSGNMLSVTEVADNGFGQIKLATTIASDKTFSQVITYLMAEGRRASLGKKLDEFLAKATPEGGVLDETFDTGSFADGWTLTFKAASLAELNAATNQALGSERSNYALEEVPAPSNPTLLRTTLTGTTDCASICSPSGIPAVQTFIVPAEWDYVSGPSEAAQNLNGPEPQTVTLSSQDYRLVFERATPLQSMVVNTVLGFNGGVTQTFEFVVSAESVARVGTAFEDLLAPNDDTGTFEVVAGEDATTYKAVVQADSIEVYNKKIQSYVPGAVLERTVSGGWALWPDSTVQQYLPLADGLASGGVTEAVKTSLELPAMYRFVSSESTDPSKEFSGNKLIVSGLEEASKIAVVISGPTLSGLIFLGVLVLVLLAAAAFAFIFRRKMSVAMRAVWDKRDAAGAAAGKLAATVAQTGAAAATGVAGAAAASKMTLLKSPGAAAGAQTVEGHRELFTESDLH
ncbi:hypothetical protein ART_0255 [Arthrobacter sp. PAMC 25486]|uniref:hypothetical protein n=1 Tax=Arthrobacter sp. PAMC 25486 TaxID=1494608 RepID=UPI000536327F|nr:hypothetical protein [Arthrobacter sp. PAMC 25486]AIX99853.1 hypothetical protein ART_0255 [Arthrobacter sp. PAMC 25486]